MKQRRDGVVIPRIHDEIKIYNWWNLSGYTNYLSTLYKRNRSPFDDYISIESVRFSRPIFSNYIKHDSVNIALEATISS